MEDQDHFHAVAWISHGGKGETYAVRWCGSFAAVADALGDHGEGYMPEVVTIRRQKRLRPEGGPCKGHQENHED